MVRFNFILSALAGLMMLFVSVNASAEEVTSSTVTTTSESPEGGTVVKKVTTTKVITPVPAAKEVIAVPQGYVSCFTVEAGWYNNIWVPAHQVCQYENSAQGVVWIEGYWGCNAATPEGVCTNWEWKAGHWEKKMAVY